MSYEPSTGWTRLTGRQVGRYARVVEDLPNDLDERLVASGLDHYWDTYGSLHARCMPSELWVLLSGQPSRFDDPDPSEPTEQQWISVTELGAVFTPVAATSSVLKLLREEGLLERKDGKDYPTPEAEGLYMERLAAPAGGRELKPGTVQRLWSYEVLVRLRARRPATADDTVDSSLSSEPAPLIRPLIVQFPAECHRCGQDVAAGSEAFWNPTDKTVRCAPCVAATEPATEQT